MLQKHPLGCLLLLATAGLVTSFTTRSQRSSSWKLVSTATIPPPATQLHFFWQNKKNKEDIDNDSDISSETLVEVVSESKTPTDSDAGVPFFARLMNGNDNAIPEKDAIDTTPIFTTTTTSISSTTVNVPIQELPKQVKPEPLSPLEQAKALKAQAQRARLEAEKMDAQLTLSKISKLEQEMATAKSKGNSVDDLLNSMDILQRKMRGESPLPIAPTVSPPATKPYTATYQSNTKTESQIEFSDTIDQSIIDQKKMEFDQFSDEFKLVIANMVGMNVNSASEINVTEYALRSSRIDANDYTVMKTNTPAPSFSKSEIEKFKKTPAFLFKKMLEKPNDEDAFAIKELTNEYYKTAFFERNNEEAVRDVTAKEIFSKLEINFTNVFDESDEFRAIQTLFPACVLKEGKGPTEAQANLLMSDILPKVGFQATGKPTPVFGGYLICGNSKEKSGDKLIDMIDEALAKSTALRNKLTVIYLRDVTAFLKADPDDDKIMDMITGGLGNAIYVLGPDISREPRPVVKTIVSAFGIATSWYLSIYPFLMNDVLSKRVDEQVSLADASMAYDLTWLTDLSFPLFVTFMGIQLTHEVGHRIAAGVYGLNITVPTFIPSIATGITSTLTSLKSPPKNREQLFDFAVAGPLFGIVASTAALYIGLQMTAFADPSSAASFPALPLQILRQSTLGGGIIESVLGSGTLSVPDGAYQLISSINIPLHPVALAGFISLIVNAFALLPIGTTDGGRMSQAVFNRAGKGVIGQFTLLVLLGLGLLGDDLFLFYFFYCSLFQQGNEIPLRNEVDDISFARVLLATGLGVVSLLTLIPMQ